MPPAKNTDSSAQRIIQHGVEADVEFDKAHGKPLYDTVDSKTFVEAHRIHAIADRAQLECEQRGCECGPLSQLRALEGKDGRVTATRDAANGKIIFSGVDMEVLDAVNCLLEAQASDPDFRNHPMLNPSKFAAELA